MGNDEEVTTRWLIDLEAIVASNVRTLREGRSLTQQQLGSDLSVHGVGMHQTTVAKLEAGAKPLRLNEVAAIAAYFEVPIESLWEPTGVKLREHEETVLLVQINAVKAASVEARAELERTTAELALATETQDEAHTRQLTVVRRERALANRLADLELRREAVQVARGSSSPMRSTNE